MCVCNYGYFVWFDKCLMANVRISTNGASQLFSAWYKPIVQVILGWKISTLLYVCDTICLMSCGGHFPHDEQGWQACESDWPAASSLSDSLFVLIGCVIFLIREGKKYESEPPKIEN